jgi:hypothetical protein
MEADKIRLAMARKPAKRMLRKAFRCPICGRRAHTQGDLTDEALEDVMEAEAIASGEIPSKSYSSFAEMLRDFDDWQAD